MTATPIDLYTWTTPNGHKVHIALEEMGLPYKAHWVNIGKNEQFTPEFLAVSPNNKIPGIIDHDGIDGSGPITMFESGAILIYLADKTGKLLAASGAKRYETLQWVMFQMGGVGPMMGQYFHFKMAAQEKIPYAIERYGKEVTRLFTVANTQLGKHEYLAGHYSIADIAAYPWMKNFAAFGIEVGQFTHVDRWVAAIADRPAVQRGMALKP